MPGRSDRTAGVRASVPPAIIALLAGLLAIALAPTSAEAGEGAVAERGGGAAAKPYRGPRIPTPNARRCDFLDTSVCLHPWPSDLYTRRADGTATGRRVNLDPRSMPENAAGEPVDPTDHNRNDGFSPGQAIVVKVPGLGGQRGFERSGIVSIDDPRAYRDRPQPVVVLNARTKRRHPVFAEMDANPEGNRERTLIIRPLVNWEEGERYIVTLRHLRRPDGRRIRAQNSFRVYRDRLITDQPAIERRRPFFERRVLRKIESANRIGRAGLYMAWDFTVASSQSLSERVLAMRDDAFARLGDTDLADRTVQGRSPDFTVTNVEENPDAEILRRVEGTLDDVPCYLDQNGCPPGSQFAYPSDGAKRPRWNRSFTVDVPFSCDIPSSVDGGGTVEKARLALYGHGLLGSRRQAGSSYVRSFADAHNVVHCAVNWAGFSEDDVLPVILPGLSDVSELSKAFDRMQQGFINFMMLGRAMIHRDGFASDPAFRLDAGGGARSVLKRRALYFYGNSQGGIMGGALTALEPDLRDSVLGVPGMNYSTLLRRSVDFDQYAELPGAGLYDNYPNELERPLLLGLMQMLWDRGEANGYAHHIGDDPYPNTPRHRALLHAALGDHQVANLTAENMARTIDARHLRPGIGFGRHWERRPFFRIRGIDRFPYRGSALVYWDGGPVGFDGTEGMGTAVPPDENVPPREEEGYGADPHSYPRKAPEAQQQISDWMAARGGLLGPCAGGEPCYSNGWTGP